MQNIHKAIKILLETKPFYANFYLNSRIVVDEKRVPTACVSLTKTEPVFTFNPKFLESLSTEEVIAVIEHETLHVMYDHLVEMKKDQSHYEMQIKNIAMDCAINQYINNVPKGGVTLGSVEQLVGHSLTPKETWEYYYNAIKPVADKAKAQAMQDEAENATGHHLPLDTPMSAEEAKQVVKSTVDRAIKESKGNIPSELTRILNDFNREPTLPWQSILSNFVARVTTSVTLATRKKRNRRFGIQVAGKKKKRELTIGVCVDTSGSVSDESFTAFISEIKRISSLCSKVYYIQADAKVKSVDVLTKKSTIELVRRGYGGTAYQPAINKAMEQKVDAIIYFGDMDSADTPIDPSVPFLWAIVGDQKPPADFGYKVNL